MIDNEEYRDNCLTLLQNKEVDLVSYDMIRIYVVDRYGAYGQTFALLFLMICTESGNRRQVYDTPQQYETFCAKIWGVCT